MTAPSKPKISQVPESMLFDNTDDCFKAMPEDPAVPMVGVYDYDLLRADAEKLAEALDDVFLMLDEGLIVRDISCDHKQSFTVDSMKFVIRLQKITQALAEYSKRWPKEK